ncbi:S-adenosyl-L-methionine-dependent methyltransferase [Phlebopus sp. FC_14]|nr:S-adenosyl-L-methionine-dependent methyltransferase [Phlebopus sp. FC_14]
MTSSSSSETALSTDQGIIHAVEDAYSSKAREGADLTYAEKVAKAFGYTSGQLTSIPAESHLGLSCGNPVAAASIKEGETVLDLGSGGGVDVFLAASKTGPSGQVIGLDVSPDMISLARRNAARKNLKPPHVAFVQTSLTEDLPIESNSVDCVLSNCVINLLPPSGKVSLMKEVHRVLKPGGRVVLDDIIANKPFPETLRSNLAAYIGCISGSIQLDDYRSLMENAGFPSEHVLFVKNNSDLNVYTQTNPAGCAAPSTQESNCCAPRAPTGDTISDIGNINEWAASYQIYAIKMGGKDQAPVSVVGHASALKDWWKAYPTSASASSLPYLKCEQVADLIQNPNREEKDFVVVDVRRNDHAGGHVRGSVPWAAQTFFDDLPKFHEKYKDTKQVIFYCASSNGRGPRCAGWYQDYLNEQGMVGSNAIVMEGGIKAWKDKFGDVWELTDRD